MNSKQNGAPTWRGPTRVRTHSGELEYHDIGQRPVLVSVHLVLADASHRDRVVPMLADRFRCICPTLPIGAHRIPADADISVDGLAGAIADMVDHLDVDGVTVAGDDSDGGDAITGGQGAGKVRSAYGRLSDWVVSHPVSWAAGSGVALVLLGSACGMAPIVVVTSATVIGALNILHARRRGYCPLPTDSDAEPAQEEASSWIHVEPAVRSGTATLDVVTWAAVDSDGVLLHSGVGDTRIRNSRAARWSAHGDQVTGYDRRGFGLTRSSTELPSNDGVAVTIRDAIRLTGQVVADPRDGAPVSAAPRPVPSAPTMRRRGDVWELVFAGRSVTVRTSKGLADLAVLLAAAGREVHCLDLVGAAAHERSTGDVIDSEARRQYEQRIRDLQDEIDAAERDNDYLRSEQAQVEFDALVEHLSAALGSGGRTRRSGGTTERARSTVTQRLRMAMRRIDELHPELGRHLQRSIRTGIYCSYSPEHPTDWHVPAGPG